MKRIVVWALVLAVMVAPVFANGDPAEPQEAEPVTVSTLEDLQAAIDAAEDGAIIAITQTITINGESVTTDKDITLTRAEDMTDTLLQLWNGGEISGFSFVESGAESSYTTISVDYCYNNAITIENCNFAKGEGAASYILVYGNIYTDDPNRATISGCSFELSAGNAIKTRNHTYVEVDDCSFSGSVANVAWAVDNADTAVLTDCAIIGNGVQSFSIRNMATMQIDNLTVTRDNRDNKAVFDIFSTANATLTITQESAGEDAVYSLATKSALELPLTEYKGELQLVFLTADEAAAYFAPDEPEEPEEPAAEPQDEPEPQDQPDDPANEPQNEPAQNEQPPAEQENAQDTTPQDTTPAEETPQQQPEQPRDNTQPVTPYVPIYTYHGGGEIVPADEPEENTATVAETPVVASLVCGGAVVDTARRVVLQGFEDGELHLDAPLTRAQMATIIYRLLDDATIEQYSNSAASFADVPPDAWYAPFVLTINSAGIVQGVGGGNYAPDSNVTWAQIITLLARFVPPQDHALEYISCPAWAQDAMQTAVAYGWITDSASFDAAAEITRGEFAALVNAVLDMVEKGATAA